MDWTCIVKDIVIVCFTIFQNIAPPANVNTNPDVDFKSSTQPAKSESIYPTQVEHH